MTFRTALALLLAVTACGGRSQPSQNPFPAIPITVESLQADSIAQLLIKRAVAADAQLQNPDSAYADDAEVIANGVLRVDAPRLAGVAAGGAIQLGSTRFSVTGSYVWGTVEYRWVPSALPARMVAGWATIVIARLKDGNWRILHVHSSTPSVADTTGS